MTEAEFQKRVLVYTSRMYACAISLVRDSHVASDCVQEVCIKLWEISDRLEQVENMGSYCVQSVRRKCIDYMRTREQKEYASLESIVNMKTADVSDDYRRDKMDELEMVRKMLARLPENQRMVLELSGISGLSNSEIEEVTGFSGDNVRVLLSRGRKKLRDWFK